MAIAVGVAFAVSFILYKDKKEDIKEQAEAVIPAEELPVSQAEAVTEETLGSPVSGKVVPTSEISDATFAEEILGTTVAVEPEAAELVAPCDGTILSIYDTGHAVCMTCLLYTSFPITQPLQPHRYDRSPEEYNRLLFSESQLHCPWQASFLSLIHILSVF